MKKALSLILALLMVVSVFALAGCGGTEKPAEGDKPAEGGAPAEGGTPAGTEPAEGDAAAAFDYTMIDFLSKYDSYRYDGEINVLYLVCTTYAEYFPNSFAVWEPKLAEYGIHMELVGPPEYSDASLIATMEAALASGSYDCILLYPITPQAITPLLDDIWNTYKVPVVAYAFDPSTECGHYYMGTSYYSCGEVLGRSIIDYVNANAAYFDTLDTIPVAIYKNSAGAEQYQRIVGAWDVLKADGRFSLIEEYEANNEAVCLAQTETVLSTHPEVEVFLTQIDNDVSGTYQTVTSGVYPCSEYISIWGFDATGAVMSLMAQDGKDGYVQGSAVIGHYESADALIEFLPIVVGAAKQDTLIEFTEEEFNYLGTILKDYYVTVTPEIIDQYYTPAS